MQVDILEETTRYILSLEQKLLEKVREHGLPEKLVKMKDNLAVSDDLSDSDNTTDNIDMKTLQSILHKYAQPEVERRLKEQNIEEEKRLEEHGMEDEKRILIKEMVRIKVNIMS